MKNSCTEYKPNGDERATGHLYLGNKFHLPETSRLSPKCAAFLKDDDAPGSARESCSRLTSRRNKLREPI